MWIDANTGKVFATLDEVRASKSNVSFTAAMSDDELASVGVFPLLKTDRPQVNPMTHYVKRAEPKLVDGKWVTQWAVIEHDRETSRSLLRSARASRIDMVKEVRRRRATDGGILVGSHWFFSDAYSRIQQLTMAMAGAELPADTVVATMGGSVVPVTPIMARRIVAAGLARDSALLAREAALIQAIEESDAPESIDIESGWPPTFSGS